MRSHGDAIADTHDGYTLERSLPHLWRLQCLWCDWYALGHSRASAIERYRAHESEMLANEHLAARSGASLGSFGTFVASAMAAALQVPQPLD